MAANGRATLGHQPVGDFRERLNELFAAVAFVDEAGRQRSYSTPYVAKKITEDPSHETTVSRVYLAALRSGRNANPTIAVVKAIAKFFDERRAPDTQLITAAYLLGVDEVEERAELQRKLADRQVRTIVMRTGAMTPALRGQLLEMLDALDGQAPSAVAGAGGKLGPTVT
jgi:transcriptional regulator with XRE-family HTH domain